MIRIVMFLCRCLPLLPAAAAPAQTVVLVPDVEQRNQLEIKLLEDGVFEITTKGIDPYLLLQKPKSVPEGAVVLSFEYFCPEGIDALEVYYGPRFTADHRLSSGPLGRAESWMPHAANLKFHEDRPVLF